MSTNKTNYTFIEFPLVQDYFECEWFNDEAILHQDLNKLFLYSSYFIPNHRIKSKIRIANGLAEVQCYLKELTQDEEYGTYHNDLFKALQDAIDCMRNLD